MTVSTFRDPDDADVGVVRRGGGGGSSAGSEPLQEGVAERQDGAEGSRVYRQSHQKCWQRQRGKEDLEIQGNK